LARLFVLAVLAAFALVKNGVPTLHDVTAEPYFLGKEMSVTATKNRKDFRAGSANRPCGTLIFDFSMLLDHRAWSVTSVQLA
jgi:hypothetical protein